MCKKPKISKYQLRSYTTPVPIKATISLSELNNSLNKSNFALFKKLKSKKDTDSDSHSDVCEDVFSDVDDASYDSNDV